MQTVFSIARHPSFPNAGNQWVDMKKKIVAFAIANLIAGLASAQTITQTTPPNGLPNLSINGTATGENIADSSAVLPTGHPVYGATAIPGNAISIGGFALGQNSVQIGGATYKASLASGTDSVAIGAGATSDSMYATALGADSVIAEPGRFGTAVGNSAYVYGANGTAVGARSYVMGNNSVAIGAGSAVDQQQTNVVSFGSAAVYADPVTGLPFPDQVPMTRRLINVTDGVAASDAVTVGQASTMATAVAAAANTYTDRSSAATLNASRVYSDAGFSNAIASANSYTDQSSANTLQSANAYTDRVFGSFDDKVAKVNRRAGQGVAAAMAMMQSPVALSPGETGVTAGIGSYAGYSSLAIGVHRLTNQNTMVSAGIALTGGAPAMRIGGSFKFK